MYSASEVKRGILNPTGALWRIYSDLSRAIFNRNDPPIPMRDWDNLLLLDACRYDLFKECNILPGELEPYYSVASNTAEFVRKTFKNQKFPDIVCVTSTPKYYKPNVEDSFHDIVHVWKDDWCEKYRTVLPETMNNRVLEVNDKYPNKRILAHYIPPHQPFIGETGRQMPHQIKFSDDIIQHDVDQPNVWDALKNGKYSKQRVWEAYKENLELTLPKIRELLKELQGKTVITSDHGNAFGEILEFKLVGHPNRRHIKSLIEVPWLAYQNGNRKKIESEKTSTVPNKTNDKKVEERLVDLGYVY
jgi:hypothetical protein